MKRKVICLITIIMMFATILPMNVVHAGSYGNISEQAFVDKINSLKQTFVHGKYWNKYNGLSHTGDTKCKCQHATCPGWCSCLCGAFVYEGKEIAWQCHGYALMIGNKIFGGNPNEWSRKYDVNSVCAGDIARIDNDGHSIFIYKVEGNNIYYTDCNATGQCQVNWNGKMTKSVLKSRLSWIYHLSGNSLTGVVSNPVTPIHKDNNVHVRDGYFTFKNSASGTFLNVYGGKDQDETPVTTWTYDDSIDQRFNVVHKGNGKYKLYAECSSNGSNRVVDIYRGNSAVAEGQSVDIYSPNDDTAQLFYIYPVNDTEFVFEIASKEGYVIAPSASAAGSNSKSSQLKVQKYTGGAHQKWILCNNNGKPTTPFVTYTAGSYKVNTGGTPIRYRTGPGVTNAEIGTIPDNTVLKVTQVNKNWGYTSYNGKNGWILLDFTEYTVTLDSISVSKTPNKTSYYVGDKFDPTGMEISANYSNGQKEYLASGFELSCDTNSAGTKAVNVSYKGKSTSFNIEVKDLEVNAISLYSNDIAKEYYVGDTLIEDEISILANYNNGTESMIVSGFTTSYDFSTPGTKTVTISYGGKSTSYTVEVIERDEAYQTGFDFSAPDSLYAGQTRSIYVALAAFGVYDGNAIIEYDPSKIEILDVLPDHLLESKEVYINKNYDTNKIRISFAGTSMLFQMGHMLELKVRVRPDADGTTDIRVSDANMYDLNGAPIECDLASHTFQIISVVNSAEITNIQSRVENGRKIVTADVSNDDVMCYLVEYEDGALVECDTQQPSNGKVELSVADNGKPAKFMVWNALMRPLMNARDIY